ncbi:unnamed protein product [Pseudo-nitzschia multistriata]|uniref:DUF6824 domain-containing protein n=1 Tax=Pseudo-nitzschia multistriata TaxID=183589 RepID=A0A448ZJZ0_9STRA|nr:unnamed protein product [Pseudo-nitzschia multistriata]
MMNVNSCKKSRNEINPNDVLCGRGGLTNSNIGNKRFRSVVAKYQQEYLHARKNDKKLIARRIITEIKENDGRFLQRSSDPSIWSEISMKKALEKTSQALREGLDVRHKTVRPEKLVHKIDIDSNRWRTPKKTEARVVEGVVIESPSKNEIVSGEDVPNFVQESETHEFDPIFTFSHAMISEQKEHIQESESTNIEAI